MSPLTPPSAAEVRTYRESAGQTQAALAAALGCSKRAVEQWEAGGREPPAYLRLAFAALTAKLEPWTAQ